MTTDIDEIVRRLRLVKDRFPTELPNDAADALERLKAERDDLLKANQLLHGFLTNAEARAEAAEKERDELRNRLA